MTLITVNLKANMSTGPVTFYSLSKLVKKNTAAARCSLLATAYEAATAQGVNVNNCFHTFN